MAGRAFDAQVVLSPPSSPLGRQLSQYVRARIIRLDNVDLGLFDWDRNNTLYFFVLNGDEQIYLRYGGRDSASPDTYLSLESLELALKQGLELHQRYQQGQLKKTERPASLSAKQFPLLVERTFARNQCVECHLVQDFQNIHREMEGKLDKRTHVYRSPDLKTLGIYLDVPKGLVVKEAKGAAAAAGIQAGDRITHWGEATGDLTPVYTFADLQYRHDRVNREAQSVRCTVERAGQPVVLTMALPVRWWWTDIRWRQSSVDPRSYFEDRPLTPEERQKYGLPAGTFASEVKQVSSFAKTMHSHELQLGDVITAVDGIERDAEANTADLFIKLRRKAGDSVTLTVLRGGQKLTMPLKTFRMSFRK